MKLKLFLPGYLLIILLGMGSLAPGQGLQGTVNPESNPSLSRANKAKFALTDFYYRDEEGKKIPLSLYLKAFAVRLRPGIPQDSFTGLFKDDPRVAAFVNRPDLNLLIVQVKKEVQSDKARLLEMINEFNTSSPMVQFATPIVQSQGKTLILTDEFEAEFKSFVLPEEINAFNKKHYLERLNVEKRDNKYDLFVLQLTPASDKNILEMVHIYEEDDLVKHVQPRFLSFPRPLVVKTTVTPSVVSPGDPILYRLQIIRDPEVQIEESLLLPGSINLKPAALDAKSFKILNDPGEATPETPTESRTEEGQLVMVKRYYLIIYAPGEYEIPSVNVLYTFKKGETPGEALETQEVQSDPTRVKVVSLLSTGMTDINGILPEELPADLMRASKLSAYGHFTLGLILILVSLGGTLGWIYTRAKQPDRPENLEGIAKENAVLELEKLKGYTREAMSDLERRTAAVFYEDVHRSFRKALGLFYGFNAESGSTSTVLRQLESISAEDTVQKGAQWILQGYCDRRFLPRDLTPMPTQAEVEEILSKVEQIAQRFKEKMNHG